VKNAPLVDVEGNLFDFGPKVNELRDVGDPKALFHIDTLRPTEIILQEAKIIERSQVSMPLAPKTMECFLIYYCQ
jgi:hypothetical protein